MNIKDYYLQQFRVDFKKVELQKASNICNTDDLFFSREELQRVLKTDITAQNHPYFIFSMFITIASDQIIYTYFPDNYSEFRNYTRYPKFGYCGLGPHNENPLMIVVDAVEKKIVPQETVEKLFSEAAELFIAEIKDFFEKYMCSIQPEDFFRKFITDKHILKVCDDYDYAAAFIQEIKKNRIFLQ